MGRILPVRSSESSLKIFFFWLVDCLHVTHLELSHLLWRHGVNNMADQSQPMINYIFPVVTLCTTENPFMLTNAWCIRLSDAPIYWFDFVWCASILTQFFNVILSDKKRKNVMFWRYSAMNFVTFNYTQGRHHVWIYIHQGNTSVQKWPQHSYSCNKCILIYSKKQEWWGIVK